MEVKWSTDIEHPQRNHHNIKSYKSNIISQYIFEYMEFSIDIEICWKIDKYDFKINIELNKYDFIDICHDISMNIDNMKIK